ncbi:MAG TPA: YiiD C-terminal domain-containing protein [Steroidobacteraceae bacterium]|nr:YiiD C-terminal domain-containing protein [Steroidobacteraceae bacterium]
MTAAELAAYIDAHIPLARALGVQVVEVSEKRVRLAAPLAPNLNHQQTAFGGSVASLALLSGWAWLHARLATQAPRVRLVIQRQQTDYLVPIDDVFEAVCSAPSDVAWRAFSRALAERGRGRVELTAEIRCRSRLAATFRGLYVATTEKRAAPE